MLQRCLMLACVFVLTVTLPLHAQQLRQAKAPEDVGLSSERLKRLSTTMQAAVDTGELPGVAVVIARQGQVAFGESVGFRDREAGTPMALDSIHRIASMTKPITSLAAMMLVEEGRIGLSDPVFLYLPEFKELKVGVEKKDDAGPAQLILETPQRPMTVQDLLRHTSGLTYGFFGKSLVKDQYNDMKVTDPDQTNAEMVTKLAKLPLQYHPGTTWEYSMSTDVLGRIIEVVSGMDLDRFTHERILKPLKMDDTGFWVEQPEKHGRIAQPQIDPATGKRPTVPDKSHRSNWLSGGGGMVSTAADYARFCQFLLNGGQLDGVRLVSRKTVAYMASDHLPPGTRVNNFPAAVLDARVENGQSFGLGFTVRVSPGRSAVPGSLGDFGWVGAYGTQFWVDPQEQMFGAYS